MECAFVLARIKGRSPTMCLGFFCFLKKAEDLCAKMLKEIQVKGSSKVGLL